MRILLCHNHYQHPGGEDQTFADEGRLLESRGHQVIRFTLHNDVIEGMNRWELARKTLWNNESYQELQQLIRAERPQVMHCTNTFPLISPAAYYAAHDENVPVVQSLHNYRMFCANSLFLRKGQICESCLGKRIAWPAILHGCYRGSRVATAGVAAMLGIHRAMKTWHQMIRLFCTPSEFARGKFIEGGMEPERILVKPNFVFEDSGPGTGSGRYFVFVGRLSNEKGVEVLVDAWRQMHRSIPLKIVGDGPLAEQVARAAQEDGRIEWLGRRSVAEVSDIIGDACGMLLPSICYETFGRSVIEAYCKGTPVIASNQGAMAELIQHGRTGLLVDAGNAAQLAAAATQLFDETEAGQDMRRAARDEYERSYTADQNHQMLMEIYRRACGGAAAVEPSDEPQPVSSSAF